MRRLVCLVLVCLACAGASAPEQLTCVSCAAGDFLNQATGVCEDCPPKMTSFSYANASAATDCVCLAGFTPSVDPAVSVECEQCAHGFFKPADGNATCTACAALETTDAVGNTNESACVCVPGHYHDGAACQPCAAGTFKGSTGDQACSVCPADHYCPEGSVTPVACPADSTSPGGGQFVFACSCRPGFFATFAAPHTCVYEPLSISVDWSGVTLTIVKGHSITGFPTAGAHPFGLTTVAVSNERPEEGLPAPDFYTFGSSSFTVPLDYDGPDIYYYCTNHGGMGPYPVTLVDPECVSTTSHTLTCSECPQGQYNERSNRTSCRDCPSGTYMNQTGSDEETDCVYCPDYPISTSDLGTTSIFECVCFPGYYNSRPEFPYVCEACPAGTYSDNFNLTICAECPTGKYGVQPASAHVRDCSYCPDNTDSAAGSDELVDCKCDAGFFSETGSFGHRDGIENKCTECAAGSYNPTPDQTACLLCPVGTFSTAVGAIADPCVQCADGFVALSEGTTACTACGTGTYQNLTLADRHARACSSCPVNSDHSQTASVSVLDCNCAVGFRRDATGAPEPERLVCAVCDPGHFCANGVDQTLCPADSHSPGGVFSDPNCIACGANSRGVGTVRTDASFCQCVAGAEGSPGNCSLCVPGEFQALDLFAEPAVATDCVPCATGSYQPGTGSTVCLGCNGNASSLAGSDAANDCKCVAGFFGPDAGPCEPCPRGSFCPGQQPAPSPCRLHSSSPPRSDAQEDCFCLPGFVGARTDPACAKCPPGSYCPGDAAQFACSSNSSSLAGSDAIEDCTCRHGYWRHCIATLDGGFADSAGEACTIDWAVPCVPCGEDVICFNNSLLECPDNSQAPRGSHTARDCVCDDGYYSVYG